MDLVIPSNAESDRAAALRWLSLDRDGHHTSWQILYETTGEEINRICAANISHAIGWRYALEGDDADDECHQTADVRSKFEDIPCPRILHSSGHEATLKDIADYSGLGSTFRKPSLGK